MSLVLQQGQQQSMPQPPQPMECKCMHMQTDYLGGIGVSPDSGIEFDRWADGSDVTPKWGQLVGKSFVLPTVYDADANE